MLRFTLLQGGNWKFWQRREKCFCNVTLPYLRLDLLNGHYLVSNILKYIQVYMLSRYYLNIVSFFYFFLLWQEYNKKGNTLKGDGSDACPSDGAVDLLFLSEKCIVSTAASELMRLVHQTLRVSWDFASNVGLVFSVQCCSENYKNRMTVTEGSQEPNTLSCLINLTRKNKRNFKAKMYQFLWCKQSTAVQINRSWLMDETSSRYQKEEKHIFFSIDTLCCPTSNCSYIFQSRSFHQHLYISLVA